MSLLISGLNLPNDKPVTLFITSNRNVYLEGVLLSGKAVPFPPHGRLIDADALTRLIEFEMRHYAVKDEFDKGRVAGWNNVIRAIREYMPTIIPAEEETQ